MPAPYGLEIVDNCASCAWKKVGFFCQLSSPALKSFEEVNSDIRVRIRPMPFSLSRARCPEESICCGKGRVKLTMTSADGKSIILHVAEAGELIGVQAAMSGKSYEISAETLEPCQVNFIKREAFARLMHDHRDIGSHVTSQISNDYQAACVQIRSLGLSRTAEEKVARFLLDRATNGRETNQGIRMNVALTPSTGENRSRSWASRARPSLAR